VPPPSYLEPLGVLSCAAALQHKDEATLSQWTLLPGEQTNRQAGDHKHASDHGQRSTEDCAIAVQLSLLLIAGLESRFVDSHLCSQMQSWAHSLGHKGPGTGRLDVRHALDVRGLV
jgi:hypothetical protein